MFKIIIILAIIGLLKVVSLFILCLIDLYNKIIKSGFIECSKTYGIFVAERCYFIPTITFSTYVSKHRGIEISFMWLNFEYYSSYTLIYEGDDESS